jgi:hypothetical protein
VSNSGLIIPKLTASLYNPVGVKTEIIFAVHEASEGGYEARALGHSIFTQADTMDELKVNGRETVHCHFDEGTPTPVIRLSK